MSNSDGMKGLDFGSARMGTADPSCFSCPVSILLLFPLEAFFWLPAAAEVAFVAILVAAWERELKTRATEFVSGCG